MKARMKNNLIERYMDVLPGEYTEDVVAFLESIENKEVELKFTGPDAFEVNDDNYWLPNELWEEV